MALTWINTVFFQELMAEMRAAIADGTFPSWKEETLARVVRNAPKTATSS